MARKTGRAKRLAFFDRGNTECPICLSSFSRDETAKGSRVTLEHAPPKALGGAIVCLTCADCNAGAGGKTDQAVATINRATLDRMAGRGEKVEVNIFGTLHTTYLSPEGFSPEHLAKISRSPLAKKFVEEHPVDQVLLLAEITKKSEFDFEKGITITIKYPETRLLAVSWLRSAYLLVFSLLGRSGYRFAKSEALRPIREQIMQPDRDVAPFPIGESLAFPGPKTRIAIQDSAKPLCWLVKMDRVTVALPRGGDAAHFKDFLGLPEEIRSLKRSWLPAPFGQMPSVDLSLRKDPGPDSDLFGCELTIPVGDLERRCIVANQQGALCTFIPSGPVSRRLTSGDGR